MNSVKDFRGKIEPPVEKGVLKIERYAQRLTQGYSEYGGSYLWAPGSFSSRDKSVVLTGETKGDILQGPKLEKRAPWRLRKFQKAISFCPSALSRSRKHLIFIHRSIIQAAGKLMHVIAERQFKRTILGAKLFFFQ